MKMLNSIARETSGEHRENLVLPVEGKREDVCTHTGVNIFCKMEC